MITLGEDKNHLKNLFIRIKLINLKQKLSHIMSVPKSAEVQL